MDCFSSVVEEEPEGIYSFTICAPPLGNELWALTSNGEALVNARGDYDELPPPRLVGEDHVCCLKQGPPPHSMLAVMHACSDPGT